LRRASHVAVSIVFAFSAAVLAATWTWGIRPLLAEQKAAQEMVEIKVEAVIGSEDGQLNAVMLVPEAGEPMLPVFVERSEAMAIVARLEKAEEAMPHPADAVRSAIKELGGKLERASIEGIEPLASQGKLYVRQGNRTIELPAAGAICIELSIVENVPLVVEKETLTRLDVTDEDLKAMEPEEGDKPPKKPDQPKPSQPAEPRAPDGNKGGGGVKL
jgi:bifunctional DNase/RNase